MRARRLVAVASVAVGLVALSGCRSEPGVAAYIGDHSVTEDAVTALIDDARAKNPAPTEEDAAMPGQQPRLPGRSEVVSVLVLSEVCERVSAAENYRPQNAVDPAQIAQGVGMNPETEYVRRTAELYSCLSGIPVGEPVAPTQQELTELVNAGKRAGAVPAEVTVEQAASQLDGEQLRYALANRNSLAEAVEAYDVTVNPRYRPLVFPVLSFSGATPIVAVGVPLGEPASTAVTDVSTPKPQPASDQAAEGDDAGHGHG